MYPQQPAGPPEPWPQQPYQTAPPVPPPTSTTGQDAPGGGYPVTVVPGYPQPAPATVRGRLAFRVLLATAGVLVAAIVVTAVLGWSGVLHLRHDVASRQAQRDKLVQQDQAASRKQQDDFHNAALDSQLQHVKDLDKAADAVFRSWQDGTVRFGVLNDAIEDCDDAVIDYDRAAARFPDKLFTALPKRINLSNPETDCGRAFTGNI